MTKIAVFLVFLLSLFQCKPAPKSGSIQVTDISTELANEKLSAGDIVFIDVRTPEEISEGKIQGALELDFRSSDFAIKISELDKDKEYVVYCRSGGRSQKASDIMRNQNFQKINNLKGGFQAWKSKYSTK